MADEMSIDNKPNLLGQDESDDSAASSPEREPAASVIASGNSSNNQMQDVQQPKRKGGRKPIYATSEERKQRNRQAQAAFRERRTEYIKQLEEAIRIHESNLQKLQSAHRDAADECLMLRYKNSLLERILLEKGIDVQAELQAKADSPNLGPVHVSQNLVQPPPIQRPIMHRNSHSRRSTSTVAPKLEPIAGSGLQKSVPSPGNRPMQSSHSNSPSNAGSTFSPAPSDSISMRGSISGLTRQQMSFSGASHASRVPVLQTSTPRSSVAGPGASFYPTPSFQHHVDSLEHDYDHVQGDLVDESELEIPGARGGFGAGAFSSDTTQPMLLSPTSTGPPHHEQGGHHVSASQQQFTPMGNPLMDHQTLDWDPFGLSASMAFPGCQFPYDQTSLR